MMPFKFNAIFFIFGLLLGSIAGVFFAMSLFPNGEKSELEKCESKMFIGHKHSYTMFFPKTDELVIFEDIKAISIDGKYIVNNNNNVVQVSDYRIFVCLNKIKKGE